MTISHRTLTFEESLDSMKEVFHFEHPQISMVWKDCQKGKYLVAEFSTHFKTKPNCKWTQMFYSFRHFDNWLRNDLGDGYDKRFGRLFAPKEV